MLYYFIQYFANTQSASRKRHSIGQRSVYDNNVTNEDVEVMRGACSMTFLVY